jgi:microcin C transport system substrate-binding protein
MSSYLIRAFTVLTLLACSVPGFSQLAHAQTAPSAPIAESAAPWRHALALWSSPKYQPGFKHFDYVNPAAPKGGIVRLGVQGTFDSFNVAVSGTKGQVPAGISQIYDTLMMSSLDEVSTEYGLIAEAVRHPDDFSFVSFRLRAEARWHDGKPITPEDVIFSFEVQKAHNPLQAFYYKNVVAARKTGEREVTFDFDKPGNRELPLIVGQLIVLPKHWWEGTSPDGRKRDITVTTVEPPLGGGAYRIKSFEIGRTLVLERVKDYWAKDMPTQIGTENFDELRFEYFKDQTVLVEAFKAGKFDWREENIARQWVTSYDFPARREGRVVTEEFARRNVGVMQAFVPNLRKQKFQDPRVRRAMNLAFDFEEANKTLFFNLYERVNSYFQGTELASSGLPQGRELAILEAYRDKLPPELFTREYRNPVSGTPEATRNNLREAVGLLREAGWEIKGGKLSNAKTGERFTLELLTESPAFERVMLFYKPALERLGMEVSVRTVDASQYENRERNRDFDMISNAWGQSLSPGNEQRDFWGTIAADRVGSRNLAGIKNPIVDELIEKIVVASERSELVALVHALDRVLLWNHYVIPNWTSLKQRTLRWNRFSHPANMPAYGAAAFPTVWWWDADKAAKVEASR